MSKITRADIDAVTFDVDGTLYNLARMRRRAGLVMLRHLKLLRAYVRARETVRRLDNLASADDVRAEQARRVGAEIGIPASEAASLLEQLIYTRYFDLVARFRPFKGTRDAISRLAGDGLRIGIISDFDPDKSLDGMKLADLPWAARVNAEATGHLKPQPQPFEQAIAELDLPPERILHVGDREDTDVTGARNIGMRSALLVPRGPLPDSRADLVVRSLPELADTLLAGSPAPATAPST